ncbi:hypothetical protein C8J57DRAFT_1713052 [Mycena rebaudengoi]|nr:hypothetical protein C8J57DRAFT_1713052 [Mycena rebaudengoi]
MDTYPGLNFNICLHGSRFERCSDIKLAIKMPPVSQGALRKYTWTEQFMIDIGDDLKHTQHWGCEQCGYPARELFWKAVHWTPQPLSSMTVWGFSLCAVNTKCMLTMQARDIESSVLKGLPPHFMSPPPAPLLLNTPLQNRAESFVAPYSGSCAGCHRRSWISDREMRGMSAYKILQRDDWPGIKRLGV